MHVNMWAWAELEVAPACRLCWQREFLGREGASNINRNLGNLSGSATIEA